MAPSVKSKKNSPSGSGYVKTRRPPQGSRPGTLAIPNDAPQPKISLIQYDSDQHLARDITDLAQIGELRSNYLNEQGGLLSGRNKSKTVLWVDVQGLGDEETLLQIAKLFGINLLTIADIVNVPTRPKVEEFDSYLCVVTVMASVTSSMYLNLEQVGIILGEGFVLTLQHRYGDVFDPVRKRIRDGKGPIRKQGSDYLTYALLDAIVDGYYPVLEQVGEQLEQLENEVINQPDETILKRIYRSKREMLALRRAVWPQREAISFLARDDTPLVKKNVRVYFRDVYDHVAQVIDIIETYRELAGGFMDIYLSSLSNRMNQVMQVLTLIATIFIPLSFLAGIYGMNFEHMPELKWRWAYPVFWGVILVIVASMLSFFVKKGWISLHTSAQTDSEED